MESEKTNKILFYVIPAAVLVIIIILVVISSLSPKKNLVPTPGSSTLPTLVPQNNTSSAGQQNSSAPQQPAGSLTPTLVPVRPFTGVVNPQIPKEANDLATQKQALVDKTPLSQPFFTISFDYSQDKFVVTLKDPKQTSRAAFESWLKDNYPNVPLDRFILK